MNKEHLLDVAERVLWTAVEATLAVLAIHTADLDPMWVAPATATLALIKSYVAKYIGDGSAGLPLWASQAVTQATEEIIEVVLDKKHLKGSK